MRVPVVLGVEGGASTLAFGDVSHEVPPLAPPLSSAGKSLPRVWCGGQRRYGAALAPLVAPLVTPLVAPLLALLLAPLLATLCELLY